jgi:putrescine aminotransferase
MGTEELHRTRETVGVDMAPNIPAQGDTLDIQVEETEHTVPARVFARMRRHFSPRTAAAARILGRGAVETAAEGSRVTLSDGRSPLDFGAYAVGLLGHRPPAVVEAVHRQLDTMTISTRTLGNPVSARAAATLVDYVGGSLSRVYFGLNGCDAVEAAVKSARLATGRPRVLAVAGAYHGKSMGALALTHHPRFRAGLEELLPAVTHLDAEDAEAVSRECRAGNVAALVFEPVQGENGVRRPAPAVLAAWSAAAQEYGAMVIADEIQTGLRRCGPRSVAVAQGLPVDAVLQGAGRWGDAAVGDGVFRPALPTARRRSGAAHRDVQRSSAGLRDGARGTSAGRAVRPPVRRDRRRPGGGAQGHGRAQG